MALVPFQFEKLNVPEVVLVKPRVFPDERGFFLETYKYSDFEANGIPDRWTQTVDRKEGLDFSRLTHDRLTLVKVARWDPDKRWTMAVDAAAEMKRQGLKPLFLARGGYGDHEREVIARAIQQGLRVAAIDKIGQEVSSLVRSMRPVVTADMIILRSFLSEEQRRVLFHTANVVLANSGVEPFGLVGLETMAVGGVAFVGSTGEDYVTPGFDAVSLQTNDPLEIVHHTTYLHRSSEATRQIRRAAKRSASRHTWSVVIERSFLPLLEQLGVQSLPSPGQSSC